MRKTRPGRRLRETGIGKADRDEGRGDIGARRSSALIEEIQAEAERRFEPLGLEVSVTGEAYIGSRGIESVVRDLVGSLGLSVLLIFATLVLLFRSVRYAVIAVPPNVLPLFTTMAWMVVRGIPLNAGTAVVFSIGTMAQSTCGKT